MLYTFVAFDVQKCNNSLPIVDVPALPPNGIEYSQNKGETKLKVKDVRLYGKD